MILLTVIFYDNGVNDMVFCSDDNTYTNQQNQQFNPVEIHYDVNEQENSHQDPSDYVSINGKLFNKKLKIDQQQKIKKS